LPEFITVWFDSCPLPNQSGDHRLVFNEPVLNSSLRTIVVGAPRLAGASGRLPLSLAAGVVVVVTGGLVVVVLGGVVLGGVVVAVLDGGVVVVDVFDGGALGVLTLATGVRVGALSVPLTFTKE
jgi:hypothetical protein